MRAAIIVGGLVDNVILLDADADPAAFGALRCTEAVAIGWHYDGETFSPPPTPDEPVAPADSVPVSVSNFQARAVMRKIPMPDGRSLFTAVDTDLRAAVEAAKDLPEFDATRLSADLAWQAWEQANVYERHGLITTQLAARYGLDDARTDDLFRQAQTVRA